MSSRLIDRADLSRIGYASGEEKPMKRALGVLFLAGTVLNGCSTLDDSIGDKLRAQIGAISRNNVPAAVAPGNSQTVASGSLLEQPLLSSTRQWEKVVTDVASGLCTTASCTPPSKTDGAFSPYGIRSSGPALTCARVDVLDPSGAQPTRFESVLADGVVRELVSKDVKVYQSSWSAATCDDVRIQTTVVHLTGGARRPEYSAGELTILGEGVLAIRHFVRRMIDGATDQLAIASVALGEFGYWLSPSYLARHPMAEVAVTVAQLAPDHTYRAQYTNIYYVDGHDFAAYQPMPKPLPLIGEAPKPESPLPATNSGASSVKAVFSGTKSFGLAGATAAFLTSATSDGSTAVGAVTFPDGGQHAARLTADGLASDLGVMSGLSASAEAISDDGNTVVGLVSLSPNNTNTTVFRWTSSPPDSTSSHVTLSLADHPGWTAQSVLISTNGEVIVANVIDQLSRRKFVRWASSASAAQDPLNLALNAWLQQNPSGYCTVLGLSSDGQSAKIVCSDDALYTWKAPSQVFGSPIALQTLNLTTVQAISQDLGAALGKSTNPLGFATVVNLDGKHLGQTLQNPDFVPLGISPDGKVVFGRLQRKGAARWNIADNSVTVVAKESTMQCSAAVGVFSNGAGVLVNSSTTADGCALNKGERATVLAPP